MSKAFPENVPIKATKCPACGGAFHDATLHVHDEEKVVRARCPKDGCGFVLDLFWLGDAAPAR